MNAFSIYTRPRMQCVESEIIRHLIIQLMYYRCVGGSHILRIDLFWRVIATYRMMYEHSYVAINVHVVSVPVFAFAYVYAYTPVYVYHNR